jgi:hypothetical protein
MFGENSLAQTQPYSYRGNLIKIDMRGKSISLSDTLGYWDDQYSVDSYGQYSEGKAYYYDHLTLPGHSYLLKQTGSFMGPYLQMYEGENIIETEGQALSRPFSSTGAGWDVIPPYFIRVTEVTPVSCGMWLINGSLGNAFINNNDSLNVFQRPVQGSQFLEERLVSVLGTVDSFYLGAFMKKGNEGDAYEYRLVSLSNSPSISMEKSRAVHLIGTLEPASDFYGRIRKLHDDLYITGVTHGTGLSIVRYKDTAFVFVKTQLNLPNVCPSINENCWDFRNNKFYYLEGSALYTYDLNSADTTLINRKAVLEMPDRAKFFGVDRELKYAARIDADTLRIFDVDRECYINAIDIKGVKSPFRPVVDYPYVYLHQTNYADGENNSILGLEKGNGAVIKSYELSAFPNPFNPVTTLEFKIPAAGKVELKIYDALGKEVATLVNEERKEGTYRVQFDASSLPSGIYLCRMSAGTFSQTRKLVLLK